MSSHLLPGERSVVEPTGAEWYRQHVGPDVTDEEKIKETSFAAKASRWDGLSESFRARMFQRVLEVAQTYLDPRSPTFSGERAFGVVCNQSDADLVCCTLMALQRRFQNGADSAKERVRLVELTAQYYVPYWGHRFFAVHEYMESCMTRCMSIIWDHLNDPIIKPHVRSLALKRGADLLGLPRSYLVPEFDRLDRDAVSTRLTPHHSEPYRLVGEFRESDGRTTQHVLAQKLTSSTTHTHPNIERAMKFRLLDREFSLEKPHLEAAFGTARWIRHFWPTEVVRFLTRDIPLRCEDDRLLSESIYPLINGISLPGMYDAPVWYATACRLFLNKFQDLYPRLKLVELPELNSANLVLPDRPYCQDPYQNNRLKRLFIYVNADIQSGHWQNNLWKDYHANRRVAVALGMHPRVGRHSSIHKAMEGSEIGERKVMGIIVNDLLADDMYTEDEHTRRENERAAKLMRRNQWREQHNRRMADAVRWETAPSAKRPSHGGGRRDSDQ